MANPYINKVVYGGNTLLDVSTDTAVASDVASGKYLHLKTGERVAGTNTYDADTSDANASASEILYNQTAYVNGNKLTGSMPNNGSNNVTVTSKSGTTIPIGYYDGSGMAVIDSTSAANLVAANIRDQVTILGVTGTMSGSEDVSAQAKTVTPATTSQTVTPDSPTYNYLTSVTVDAIPYVEADNAAGGRTVTIA